jgi:hypothetical protein
MTGWVKLDEFLETDPRDVGCEETLRMLHVYVELLVADPTAAEAERRYAGIAAHLRACGPCAEDLEGLLVAARSVG